MGKGMRILPSIFRVKTLTSVQQLARNQESWTNWEIILSPFLFLPMDTNQDYDRFGSIGDLGPLYDSMASFSIRDAATDMMGLVFG